MYYVYSFVVIAASTWLLLYFIHLRNYIVWADETIDKYDKLAQDQQDLLMKMCNELEKEIDKNK